ncbi:lytic murein transglycosylase [Nitratidesulfovibrio liaohensis]|uniref:Lytic murein transglycosylase n=1 Tax=Nitratidesulfovibrio liaohensis TaxID=2604158 RepID=A0ABY9R373_9BACT|nr:lytic murein transglycosylase [Nitratidesulfovibrio liaohensis]WMW65025.1 lytic murein transglycosylase [Nitratidesulfovibrio liaohensis]
MGGSGRAVLWRVLASAALCALLLTGCSGTRQGTAPESAVTTPPPAEVRVESAASTPDNSHASGRPAACWNPLLGRLAADGVSGGRIDALFVQLGDAVSPDPMGRKVKELYTTKFLRPEPQPVPPGQKPRPARPPMYPGVVTDENAAKCRAFLTENARWFSLAESRFGVPREVAVSLLFVETRLGTALGKGNAFRNLAAMAAADTPDMVPGYIAALPGADGNLDWISLRMRQKSDWAYQELKALIRHADALGQDPLTMPGSIYGAVGICQFMPTNIPAYGVDGDGDGRVDLYTVGDAVFSLSNYLDRHGWQPGMRRDARYNVLKRYNNSAAYANTILALADKVAGKPAQSAQPTKAVQPGKPAQTGTAKHKALARPAQPAPSHSPGASATASAAQ